MWHMARWYAQFGLMAGSVFKEVLADARTEGLQAEASMIEGAAGNDSCLVMRLLT